MVLHQHIRPPDQWLKQRTATSAGQVERDAALVRVEIEERNALFAVRFVSGEGPHATGQFAFWRLNLDNFGTLIRQKARAERPRHALAKVQNAQIAQ
jgi:hypothetical protein